MAQELDRMGFLLQVNLGSLIGIYGRRVKKAARYIIDNGYAKVVASDAHSATSAKKIYSKGIPALEKLVGKKGVADLLIDGPKSLLT